MITRRSLLGVAAAAGVLTVAPGVAARASDTNAGRWTEPRSANGWRIGPAAITTYRVEGSSATVALRQGPAATVLLHVARRWHYEIAALDNGEGGGIAGHTGHREIRARYESNHLSGTAIALHPTAYPAGGSERLWPHHEAIVRDILIDCEGTVVWGGDLTPAKASHFHIVGAPGDTALARTAARLDTSVQTEYRTQTAGRVADPATPARRAETRRLPRPR
ncbi:hypothetical protein M2302_005242 [Micromonospora sp. A200]|uniref:hypothetical protein n=1 Tax=Micromonospora sp. A200 TaxID=2940568 RepID=UPI002472F539|nr:hypothetical protein [Micromonospora sp. A200]MDH6465041.1 hypothetical protein [Micromonospora sp. A200]